MGKREGEVRQSVAAWISEGKVAATLLAGGMGSLLGLDKPEGERNVGINRTLYIFQCLINNLMDVTREA